MLQFFLPAVVLLVFSHHQGSCWLDVPYSTVHHTRQLKGAADIAPEDVRDKAVISARTIRPLFSWGQATATPASSIVFPDHQQELTQSSHVSNTEAKSQRGRKLWKSKKKDNLIREEDQNHSWNYSHAPALIASWRSDGSNVSGVWLMRAERQKHRRKIKKRRDKMPHVRLQEEVTKKKQKSGKVKYEKTKKDKKRSKEEEKHREESMGKGKEKKRKKVEQGSNQFLPVSNMDRTSKNRNKTRSKQDLIPEIPSSSEDTADMVSGRNKKRVHRIGLDVTENNFNKSEAVSNEINEAKLPIKLHPFSHTSGNNEHPKPDMGKTLNYNKIPLLQLTKGTTSLEVSSASGYDKMPEAGIPEKESKSEKGKMLSEMSSLIKNSSITTGSSDVENQLQNVTEQDARMQSKHHIDLNNPAIFELGNMIEEGDWSCLNGIFLPAPHVANAKVKYTWGKYLEAEYECWHEYKMEPVETPRLVCSKHRWLGKPPKCLSHSKGNTSTPNSCMCDQVCTVVGNQSFCSCFRGFRLQDTTCHDVDECSYSKGGCEVTCRNTPGSYQCTCPSGFRLSADRKTCLDINECLLRNGHGPCQGSCHNLPGSYTCSCEGIIGTRLAADNHTCQDVDECDRNNAGCSHACLNTLGRAFCLCPPGFMLGTDWKTCHDIDECADPELQEGGRCSVGCVNTLGSYQCIDLRDQVSGDHPLSTEPTNTGSSISADCSSGFKVGPSGSCIDVDECATNNGDCSHICQNTLGAANCLCPPGFMLGNDWKTCKAMEVRHKRPHNISIICEPGYKRTTEGHCKDVDECVVQNGGCMQGCVNIRGSYRCLCGRGFFLAADQKTCIEGRMDIVCPPLSTPSYGYLHCTRQAFMVAPERWRARWRRRIVNHAGAVCELKCPHGYRVHGEYRKVCETSGSWAGPQNGFCMPFPKPNIECPHNISVEIEPGQATAFLTFPQPTTDVDWFRNVASKPSWGKLLEADLPPGYWPVTFTAHHPVSRHMASCTLGITVSTSITNTEALQDNA